MVGVDIDCPVKIDGRARTKRPSTGTSKTGGCVAPYLPAVPFHSVEGAETTRGHCGRWSSPASVDTF